MLDDRTSVMGNLSKSYTTYFVNCHKIRSETINGTSHQSWINGHYEILSKFRDKSVFVKINYLVKDKIRLKAFLNATIIKSDNITLILALVKNLIFPGKVWINIHYQALKLFLKKIKIEKKPLENKVKHTFVEKS